MEYSAVRGGGEEEGTSYDLLRERNQSAEQYVKNTTTCIKGERQSEAGYSWKNKWEKC